jgi:cobalamin biosynthesis protein CbiG
VEQHLAEGKFWVGVGCQRHTSRRMIEQAIAQVCQVHGIPEAAIAGVATIDRKANEAGLVEYCGDRQMPLRCFTAAQLSQVPVAASAHIQLLIGSPSVSEAAALLAAAPAAKLCVPKQIVRFVDDAADVTVGVTVGVTVAISSRCS